MINISIRRTKDQVIDKIFMTGHAYHEAPGKDIVCAAVSSTAITTINNILSLNQTIEYVEEKNGLLIYVIVNDTITQKILNSMIELLKELESQYPKNIEIVEV